MLLSAAVCLADAPRGVATDWKLSSGHFSKDASVLGSPVIAREGGEAFTQFNGKDDAYIVARNPIEGWPTFTIEARFRVDPDGPEASRFLNIDDAAGNRMTMEVRLQKDGRWSLDTYLSANHIGRTLLDRSLLNTGGVWHWAALTYDGKTMVSYVDGVRQLAGEVELPAMSPGEMSIGVRLNRIFWFKGGISELRFTPSALPADKLLR